MSGTRYPRATRVEIEQAIARGWDDARIVTTLGVDLRGVVQVRRVLDDLADVDTFDLTNITVGEQRDVCYRGHPLTPDNVYRRPTSSRGQRECLTCRRERSRARYRKNGRAA